MIAASTFCRSLKVSLFSVAVLFVATHATRAVQAPFSAAESFRFNFTCGPKEFYQVVHGHFDDDFHRDTMVRRDSGNILVSYGSGVYEALIEFPFAGTNLILLPGEGPGGTDAVAMQHTGGVDCLTHDPDLNTFVSKPLLASVFGTARELILEDINNNGFLDAVAVTAGGLGTVWYFDFEGAGTFLMNPPMPTFPVIDMIALNFQGDAKLELFMASPAGLQIFSHNGAEIDSYPIGLVRGKMRKFRQQNQTLDRMVGAFTLSNVPESYYLFVVDESGVELPPLLGNIELVDLVAAPMDGDTDGDVVAHYGLTHELGFLSNQSSWNPITFSLGQGFSLIDTGLGNAAIEDSLAELAVGDFDNDGDAEVISFWRDECAGIYQENLSVEADLSSISFPTNGTYRAPPENTYCSLSLDVIAPPAGFGQFTEVEVITWRRPSFLGPMVTKATRHDFFPATPEFSSFTVTIDEPVSNPIFNGAYYIEYRPVKRDVSEELQAVGPTTLVCFTTADTFIAEQLYGPVTSVGFEQPVLGTGGGLTPPPRFPCLDDPPDDDGPPSE